MKLIRTCYSHALILLFSSCSLYSHAQTNNFSYSGGIQTYTVPAGVTSIAIGVEGASGGSVSGLGSNPHTFAKGGFGAIMTGVFTVTSGQVLKVLVGGHGQTANYVSGGGGGTFVWDNASSTLMIAAGGGGGASCNDITSLGTPGLNANTGTDGVNGTTMSSGAGSGGNGGVANGALYYAASGAGWLSPGTAGHNASSCSNATSGGTPLSGGAAGVYGGNAGDAGNGGYGGGGGAQGRCSAVGGGGGGGYSGGGAGGELTGALGVYQPGGGGGSYNGGFDQTSGLASDTGNGAATIKICPTGITPGGSLSVCVGSSITLGANATGGAWEALGGATITSAGVLTGSAAGTALIAYHVSGCPSYEVPVAVFAGPFAGSVSGDATICAGSSSALMESVTGGAWSSSNTSIAAVNGSGVVSGVAAGAANITYTVTDGTTGCANYATYAVSVSGPCPSNVTALSGASTGLHIYPNPNSGKCILYLASVSDEQATVAVTNLVGMKIAELSISTNRETEAVLSVPAGIYFVNAVTKTNKYSAKLIVNP